MPITSAIRALLTYYWNIWYFLAAILGSMASLFLGAWISSEASGTPITGGYSFFFTGTQPLISLALLFILDARVSEVHYGGLPRQVYIAWLPSVLRTICRTLLIILVNLLSVLFIRSNNGFVWFEDALRASDPALLSYLPKYTNCSDLLNIRKSLKTSGCRGNFRCSSVLLDSATR